MIFPQIITSYILSFFSSWKCFPSAVASFCFYLTMCPLPFPPNCGRAEDGQAERERQKGWGGGGVWVRGVWVMWRWQGAVSVAYPSVPFLLGVLVLTVVPSGCWPSLRGGILSFILSRPRASSKLRIFLVGEKPWMAEGQKGKLHSANIPPSVAVNYVL